MITPDQSNHARIIVAVLIIVGVVTAVYVGSFSGIFLFDDLVHIVNNERIRDLSSMPIVLASKRPIVDLSLALNYASGRLDVSGYHALNLFVHVLASLVLFGLLRRSLSLAAGHTMRDSTILWLAASSALIWGVHPLQTQSVTYLIQRAESMMALFYLLTLYCFVRGATAQPSLIWFAASVCACALGMGCKAVMISAPLVVFFYDRTFLAGSLATLVRRRWGLYCGLATTWSVLWLCGIAGGVLNVTNQGAHVGFGYKGIAPLEYLKTQAGVLVTYLKLSIWPHPLCLDYDWPLARGAAEFLVPGILIVALIALALWGIIKRNGFAFLALFVLLVLAPTSSIVPIKDTFFEHRMYLPLAAIVVLIIVGGYKLLVRTAHLLGQRDTIPAWIPGGAVIVVTLLLGLGTVSRNKAYANAITMWQDVTAKRPSNARALDNLGTQWVAVGDRLTAIQQYRRAVLADPDFASAHANLGNALLQTGKPSQAIGHFKDVVRIDPNHIMATVNLGYALQQVGREDEAIEYFQTATQIAAGRRKTKSLANANYALATAYARRSNFDAAETYFHKAIELWPEYQKAHYTLGIVYKRQGKTADAVASFEQALRLDPNDPKARRALDQTLTERANNGSD